MVCVALKLNYLTHSQWFSVQNSVNLGVIVVTQRVTEFKE